MGVRIPLLMTRLVSSVKNSGEGEHCTFCIRTGTSKGVINRIFRAECARDMAFWARGLVQGTHNVVAAMREIAWDCLWRGQEARLYLHYENGLQLLPAANVRTLQGDETSPSQPKPFWVAPFGSLRHCRRWGPSFMAGCRSGGRRSRVGSSELSETLGLHSPFIPVGQDQPYGNDNIIRSRALP